MGAQNFCYPGIIEYFSLACGASTLFSHLPLAVQPFFSWRYAGFAPQTPHSLSRYAGSRRFATQFFPRRSGTGFFRGASHSTFSTGRGRIFRNDSRSRNTQVYLPSSRRLTPSQAALDFLAAAARPFFSPKQNAACSLGISPL